MVQLTQFRDYSLEARTGDMTQAMIAGQSPNVQSELSQAMAEAARLRVDIGDLEIRRDQIALQRAAADKGAERVRYDKQWADIQHDFNVAQAQLGVVSAHIAQLEGTRDMMQARDAQEVLTMPPPRDPFDEAQIRGIEIGGFILLVPLVLAFARRIWVRGGARAVSFDFDSSPRLQRIEQAIESIAVEVERIGEAQRFTTKLLAERQPDALPGRIPAPAARREPGTITPH